ncbi:MAG: SagB/ThcOx family dehydrogenase [Candidatus Paracaedibacteraceae bacterium]|nr:SagB/ThcOx family dehydrogenase [Candidatus Paracaedibacteraceae bacterium]
MKKKLYPNPDVIFYLSDEGIVAVNTLTKEEYDLTDSYFSRLKFWNGQRSDKMNTIDVDLLAGNLVLESLGGRPAWGGDRLSELCHTATRNPAMMVPSLPEEEAARQFVEMSQLKQKTLERFIPPAISIIKLPEPHLKTVQEMSLFEACKKRKTSRSFNGASITLLQLSDLLFMSFGYIHGKEWQEVAAEDLNTASERKSSPSGSGVQACDAYLTVVNIEGLVPGYYHYRADGHELALLSPECDEAAISHSVCDQFWVKGAACGIFITVDMHRVWYKSELARAYAYVFLEAGHISQTALLNATALGLKTWLSGSMRDEFVAQKFGLDGWRHFPVTAVFVGHGTDEAVPQKIRETALKLRQQ